MATNILQSAATAPAVREGKESTPVVVHIRPSKGWVSLRLRELFEYRELLYFLVWRDIKVRYKQTALGASWAIIQPFFTMVVFSIFFGKLAKMPSDGVPYPIFAFAALVPWTFFATSLTNSSHSLVGSSNLIKKVYFPRLAIPIATVLSGLVDFAIAFVMLIGMMLWYGVNVTANVLWLPLFLLLALATALGVGLWLTAAELLTWNLGHLQGVVLSACSSAASAGESWPGAMTLARPFLAAGVPLVIGSLWDVKDQDSAAFFDIFYRQLAQHGSAFQAFHEAQLAELNDSDGKRLNKNGWIAFQLYGGPDAPVGKEDER